MFYKLLDNKNNIITVSDKASFYRYSKGLNRLISVERDIADIVIINDRQYNIQGINSPEYSNYFIVDISEEEYNELKGKIENKPPVVTLKLKRTREAKIEELCKECEQNIINGCEVVLSSTREHFKFNSHDQSNINRLMNDIRVLNLTQVLYHSNDNKVKYYSVNDFTRIYKAMTSHITYHTTYFNLMKNCINNMYSIQEINNIKYGDQVKDISDQNLLKRLRRY